MGSKKRNFIRTGLCVFWLGVATWLFYNLQAHGVAPSVLESNSKVRVVKSERAFIFTPAADTMRSAIIFYPGALVDPEAYAPMARSVAEAGFKSVLVKLLFRMAPLSSHQRELYERTLSYIDQDTKKRNWIVGGHSRGGKLATQFSSKYPNSLKGMLLVGTLHPRELDLSNLSIDVTKIYGTEDGLASEGEINQFSKLLPKDTHWVRVVGGNHRQFGWYGYQIGDNKAYISREQQQEIMISAIINQLVRLHSK